MMGGGAFSDTSSMNQSQLNFMKGGSHKKNIKQNDMFSDTSSMHQSQMMGGGAFSDTSSMNQSQLNFMKAPTKSISQINSSNKINNDVEKLISMLTSESQSEENTNHNQLGGGKSNNSDTSTDMLESRLNKLLKQQGGNENNLNSKDVKNFFLDLESKGLNVDVKINDKTMSDFFGMETTTNISDMFDNNQLGGAKGLNKGMKEFHELRKIIAEKFKIKNGPSTMVLGSMIKKDFMQKNPNDAEHLIAKIGKFIDSNFNHYKNMLNNLPKKTSKPKTSKKSKKVKKSKENTDDE